MKKGCGPPALRGQQGSCHPRDARLSSDSWLSAVNRGLHLCAGVRIDFAVQADLFKFRGRPFHSFLLNVVCSEERN